jgi:hypothetical protein
VVKVLTNKPTSPSKKDLNVDSYTAKQIRIQAFRDRADIKAWSTSKFGVRPECADLLHRRVVFRKALAKLLSRVPVRKDLILIHYLPSKF